MCHLSSQVDQKGVSLQSQGSEGLECSVVVLSQSLLLFTTINWDND